MSSGQLITWLKGGRNAGNALVVTVWPRECLDEQISSSRRSRPSVGVCADRQLVCISRGEAWVTYCVYLVCARVCLRAVLTQSGKPL